MVDALVQDIASSWDQYERTGRHLMDPVPDGLILHLAGPTDEGFRIIDVWDSEASWRNFQAQRIGRRSLLSAARVNHSPPSATFGVSTSSSAQRRLSVSSTTEPRSKT